MILPKSPARRLIHPAILIACDQSAAGLGPEVTLALARRHPAALPFFAALSLPPEIAPAERRDRIRGSMELVTDLGSRHAAILGGYEVEDTLHVFIGASLGEEPDTPFEDMLGAVHQIGIDFFHDTRLLVHLLLFFPDLASGTERDSRYADAYRQLARIDALGAPEVALGFRTHSSIDYRWLIDSRTWTGAHAGIFTEVQQPIAEIVAIRLEGVDDAPLLATGEAAERLSGTLDERLTAYSAPGLGMLVHEPEVLVRYLASLAAIDHLDRYTVGPAAPEQAGESSREDSMLIEWASKAAAAQARIVAPPLTNQDPEDDPKLRREQELHRTREQERLESTFETAVRSWLEASGITISGEMLDKLLDPAEISLPGAVAAIRDDYVRVLRSFLELEEWIQREADLMARQEDLRGDIEVARRLSSEDESVAQIAAIEAKLQALAEDLRAVRTSIQRREAVLKLDLAPDDLERELRDLAPLIQLVEPEVEPDQNFLPDPATWLAPAPPPASASAEGSWLRRLANRFRRPAVPVPPAPVEAHSHTTPEPRPFPPAPARKAWDLAEEWRWILGYRKLLVRGRTALGVHTEDVLSAREYYEQHASNLADALTHRTPFRAPILQPKDLQELSARFVPPICSVLEGRYGWGSLAACWAVDPLPIPEYKTRFLERLPGLSEAVTAAGGEGTGALQEERLADLLAGNGSVELRHPLVNWVRALIEGSQPLLRPGWRDPAMPDDAVERWMLATPALSTVLSQDRDVAALLERERIRLVPAVDERFLTLATAIHGFPGHEFRKLIPLRARTRTDDVPLLHDPVTPGSARAMPGGSLYDLLVIATALGHISRDKQGHSLDDFHIRGDLRDMAEAIAVSPKLSPLEVAVRRRVEQEMGSEDAVDRLRQARSADGVSETERQILLETIAELEAQRRFSWETVKLDENV